MRKSCVHDQFIYDCLHLVQHAAVQTGFHKDLSQYAKFKQECAAILEVPEIIDNDLDEITQFSNEAVPEAISLLHRT